MLSASDATGGVLVTSLSEVLFVDAVDFCSTASGVTSDPAAFWAASFLAFAFATAAAIFDFLLSPSDATGVVSATLLSEASFVETVGSGLVAAGLVSCSAACLAANFLALARAIAAATCDFCSAFSALCSLILLFSMVCGAGEVFDVGFWLAAFLAFTRASAAATADLAFSASGVLAFILARRASAAKRFFSSRARFSRSRRAFLASNLAFALSALISCICKWRISALATR